MGYCDYCKSTWAEPQEDMAHSCMPKTISMLNRKIEDLYEEEALLYDAAQAVITTLDRSNQYEAIRARLSSAAARARRGCR